MGLFSVNGKMKKSMQGKKLKIVNFSIPAFQTKDGFKTCPMAGVCASACYARTAFYLFPKVYEKHRANLDATMQPNWIETATAELTKLKPNLVRIHDSGDFYNWDYLHSWVRIAHNLPHVKFYAYTKMVELVKEMKQSVVLWPNNLIIIFSLGGKQDDKINRAIDRHSRVFPDLDSLTNAGYVNASADDTLALTDNPKVGLVYHHPKSWDNAAWNRVSNES